VQWFCDSDYRAELLRYREQTERATNVWTRRCRNERFTRYWRGLISLGFVVLPSSANFFFARRPARGGSEFAAAQHEHYDVLLQQMATEFEQLQQLLADVFPGARIAPMKDADHYRHCATFLNPSLAERFDHDPLETFDQELSIQENCWHSEARGISRFFGVLDGRLTTRCL
jgi:hypothetical protein